MGTPGEVLEYLVYSLLCVAADVLDIVLSALASNTKPTACLLPSDADDLSDEEILELKAKAPKVHPDYGVRRLTPGTVTKVPWFRCEDAIDSPEVNALNLVFEKTNIPVPRVRRIIKVAGCYLIVMDYIKGRLLSEVWSKFSMWKKICGAFTLRRYIRQLRRLKASPSTPPGPLSAQSPLTCVSPIFGQVQLDRGPFASYAEMLTFFEKRCEMAFRARNSARITRGGKNDLTIRHRSS